MINLSDYRASIKRLIEAEDVGAVFEEEGYDGRTAALVTRSKAFKASRSLTRNEDDSSQPPKLADKMSHTTETPSTK